MKIGLFSDLHYEFGETEISLAGLDAVILAGDIGVGLKTAELIKHNFGNLPVFYVLGNHEFYGQRLPDFIFEMKNLFLDSKIHLLENDSFLFHDTEIFGCTLWTDFSLFNEPQECMRQSRAIMNDYLVIKGKKGRLKPSDTQRIHFNSIKWLRKAIYNSSAKWKIVVTHHAPLLDCLNPLYSGDLVSSAFASNLEIFLSKVKPNLWVSGHTHFNHDFTKNGVRFISNQAGYCGERVAGFKKDFSIEF